MSISHDQAVGFLRNKLHIEDVLKLDLQLLNKIIRGLLSEVPFQNVTLHSMKPENRFPTAEEIVRLGTSMRGGVCLHNNWFAYLLLKALGFDMYTIVGSYAAGGNHMDDHLMSVARGLNDPEDLTCKDTLFLVDVGNGYPTPGAVPLHRLPYEFPLTAGLEIRYAKSENFYYRLQRGGDPTPDPRSPLLDDWKAKFSFNLEHRNPSTLRQSMLSIFSADPPSSFMSILRIFRWPLDQDGRAIAFRGRELIFFGCKSDSKHEQQIGSIKERKLIDAAELETTIMKYFPMMDITELKVALPQILKIMDMNSASDF